jgi:hypothetical protein
MTFLVTADIFVPISSLLLGNKGQISANIWTYTSDRFMRDLLSVRAVKSRDSSVSIVTEYGLDGRGVRIRVLEGSRMFFSPRRLTGSSAHSASYPNEHGG